MTRVVVSATASDDYAGILRDLAAVAGRRTATRYDGLLNRLFHLLAEHPGMGAPRPGLGAGIRIGIVLPYLIIHRYDVTDDTVTILRILHGRRHITRTLIGGRA